MFCMRPAGPADLEPVFELARHLDSPNLPADREFLAGRLRRSEWSFAEAGPPDESREYQFVLENTVGEVVGTSAILSKHGTREMPHLFLRVGREERYSRSVGVHRTHLTLRLGRRLDGPTEIGALILRPDQRRAPGWPGRLLSWGRLVFIGLHPDRFERELLAEMRAAIDEEGRSAFWEAFGHRFTGMSYDEADRRSVTEKDFILDLFPEATFYASLLEDSVLEKLGEVHPEAKPAVSLLERAGFHWNGQIDPFDAGPFYAALTGEVIPIRETVHVFVSDDETGEEARPSIVSIGRGTEFRACAALVERSNGSARVEAGCRDLLGIKPGDEVDVAPLPPRRRQGRPA